MKKLLMLFAIPLLVISCNGQIKEKPIEEIEKKETIQPKADIKVNKAYDENGNLVRYDSTYVWSYSNSFGDSMDVDIDSVMSDFYPFMNSFQRFGFPLINEDIFYNDSLFYNDFLNHDYFMNRWKNSYDRMNKMTQEMDSLKSMFFYDYYPELNQENEQKDK